MAKNRADELQAATSRLTSFVEALYDEMDKLSKKAPSSSVSDLALSRVNRAIGAAKKLMDKDDEFIAEINAFVPAGDNPEVRDALLVLGEIRSGLDRLRGKYNMPRYA